MMISVFRDVLADDFTLGVLSIDGQFFGYTCEDTDRHLEDNQAGKIYGKTAIPRGEYRVVLSKSARMGKILPEVLHVPGYTGIRIHSGNTPADTDGCLLVGTVRDDKVGAVYQSRDAMRALMSRLNDAIAEGEKIYLEIT